MHCDLVLLPSNKVQQPDYTMNIISSLNFVHVLLVLTDITGTVGEESETESSSLQPRTTRKLDIIIILLLLL